MKELIQEKKWTLVVGFCSVAVLYLVSSFIGSDSVVDSANKMTVAAENNSLEALDSLPVLEPMVAADNVISVSPENEVSEDNSELTELQRPNTEVLPATGFQDEEALITSKVEEDHRISELSKACEEHLRRGQWKRAFEGLSELVDLRPYNADYHLTLGLVHRRLHSTEADRGHLEEASAKYQEYIDSGGQEAIAYLLLAETSAASGNEADVYHFLDEAASRGMNIARAVGQFPVLESFTSDTRFVRSALKLERYILNEGSYRDPFTAPWKGAVARDTDREFSYFDIEEQRNLLNEAREAISQIEYSVRNDEHDAAAEAYKKIMEITEESKRFDQPELAAELKSIGDRLQDFEDGVTEIRVRHLYEESRSRLDRMKRAFAEHDFDTVNRLHSEIQRFSQDIGDSGEAYMTTSTLVSMAAAQLRDRSDIVRTFLSRSIEIDGVAISTDGSHAIVDGEWVALGGEIQGAILQEVHRDRLVFLFEGEMIERRFGRF